MGCFFGKGGGNFFSVPGTAGNDFLSPGDTGETSGCSAPSLDGTCDSVKLPVPFYNIIQVSFRASKMTLDTCRILCKNFVLSMIVRTLGGRGGGAFLRPPAEGLVGSVGLLVTVGTTGEVECRATVSSCCSGGAGYEFPT